MTAKYDQGDRVHSKRNWNSSEEGGEISYNLRKKSKSDNPSRVLSDSLIHDRMSSRKEETIVEEVSLPQSASQCLTSSTEINQTSSLEFTPLSQDELRKIFGQRPQRRKSQSLLVGMHWYTSWWLNQDSEESEEEKELTVEELKQTEVYKLFMNDYAIIAKKKKVLVIVSEHS